MPLNVRKKLMELKSLFQLRGQIFLKEREVLLFRFMVFQMQMRPTRI